jgi:hypothetical protein
VGPPAIGAASVALNSPALRPFAINAQSSGGRLGGLPSGAVLAFDLGGAMLVELAPGTDIRS